MHEFSYEDTAHSPPSEITHLGYGVVVAENEWDSLGQ
jgi:hypothetical protein